MALINVIKELGKPRRHCLVTLYITAGGVPKHSDRGQQAGVLTHQKMLAGASCGGNASLLSLLLSSHAY